MVSILPPHRQFKDLIKEKGLPRYGRKRASSDSITFFSLFMFLFLHNLCVLISFLVGLVLFFVLFNMILFVFIFIYFVFQIIKNEKSEKYKNSVCFMYIGTCVPWMAIETKFSKLYISCSLDEHHYAQLSK